LEANLKGLPCDFKRATIKKKEVDPFFSIRQPRKKIKSGQYLEIPIQSWRRKD
jgi:hypothetical protein